MAERKLLKEPADNRNKAKTGRNTAGTGKNSVTMKTYTNGQESTGIVHQFMPFVIGVLALFITACFIFSRFEGAVGSFGVIVRNFLCGLFGWPAFILPLILLNLAVYWRKYVELDMVFWKLCVGFACTMSVSALFHSFCITKDLIVTGSNDYAMETWARTIFGTSGETSNWARGIDLEAGGFFGGLLGGIVRSLCGYIGSPILLIALVILSAMFYFSVTPAYVWNALSLKAAQNREKRAEKREELRIRNEEMRREKERLALEEKKRAEKERELAEKEEKRRKAEEERERKEREREEKAHLAELERLRIEAEKQALEQQRQEEARRLEEEAALAAAAAEAAAAPAIPLGPAESGVFDASEQSDNTPATDNQHPGSAAEMMNAIFGPGRHTSSRGSAAMKAGSPTAVKMEEIKPEELQQNISEEAAPDDTDAADRTSEKLQAYFFPKTDLLNQAELPSQAEIEAELNSNASKLMNKFSALKVKILKIGYSRGPTITRYELYPEISTRVSTIANLADDIALELGTSIRMECPIPNKKAVGVEVPNLVRSNVSVRDMIESEKFASMSSKLSACLGKDVGGNMVFFDISKMPHLLIAGTTGSGKSVCLNTIIMSLLYKSRPDEVKFVMIDPKKVEMGVYNGLPHMKVPVVTDMKRAVGTLNAAVKEMDSRYNAFEQQSCRDIDGYNRIMKENDPDFVPLPRIVIIIDELADLMMTAPKEIEGSIARLAQMSRAAGMHLIIGTQRPSANVITGLIKSNIPSRIAFAVASNVDSRIIIDMAGAEKLIGKGDMLFSPIGSTKPSRVQGAFITGEEVRRVTDFIRENNPPVVYDSRFINDVDSETMKIEDEKSSKDGENSGDDVGEFVREADPMFNRCLHAAVENTTVATSMLQRNFGMGFGRAAAVIDRMCALGFISPPRGTKPREVLITAERLAELEAAKDPRVQGRFN